MKKIDTLLMACTSRDEHEAELKRLLPNTKIIRRGYMQAEETAVLEADVIFGNVNTEYLKKNHKIQWIQLASAGADLYAPIMPKGVPLTCATGAYGKNIAEHMLAVMLYMQRRLDEYTANMKAGHWLQLGEIDPIEGATVVILGMGDIGTAFAKDVKALGAYVVGVRRSVSSKPDFADELYTTDRIDEVLPRADVVAMALPNTAETAGIMDARRLGLMKNSAYLINVGRGTAIDQQALCDALNGGRLKGAAIDVAVPEPLPDGDPLWKAKNILITPHVSGLTGTNLVIADRVHDIFKYNLDAFLNDKPMKSLVDVSTGYRRANV